MDDARLREWEGLFAQAMVIVDAATALVGTFTWSFGGGTALMLKYRHRISKDVDIFVGDPQLLGHLNPRLSPAAEAVTSVYEEGNEFVKLRLPGGEIDFIGTGWLTNDAFQSEVVLGRTVNVETAAEIIAKKIRYRADTFKARDLFDLAVVLEHDPDAIREIAPVLQSYRPALLARIENHHEALEEEFAALDLIDNRKTLGDCITALQRSFPGSRGA